MKKIKRSLLSSLIAAVLLPVSGAAAFAGPSAPSGPRDDPQLIDNHDPALLAEMRAQEKLAPAAQKLLETVIALPANSGFAGVAYEGGAVALYYKGALPADVATAVTDARKTAPVAVKPAAYSAAELARAQAKLSTAVAAQHSDIQAVGVAGDGSGLLVEKMTAGTAATMRSTLAGKKGIASKPADALLAEVDLGVPVRVTVASGPIQLYASRENDFSPWNGGGQYETWRGLDQRSAWCSTGFGVTKGGQSYVLTADHCMSQPGGDRAYNGHFGGSAFEEIGPVYQSNWEKDILLINARGSVLVFDGGVNSSFTKTVRSWAYRVTNELLCSSGSRSGVICGLKTNSGEYNTYGCDSDGDCFTMRDMARVNNINGVCAGQRGDSGGPLFSLDGNGVRAKGIVSGGAEGDCKILYYQDMDEIVGTLGATPRMG